VDLVVKGRGVRITDQIRRSAEVKLARLERIDQRVTWVEVVIVGDLNPRVGGSHRAEVACRRGRRAFRASGAGHDVDSALDQAMERLERQVSTYRSRLRNRLIGGRDRLQSRGTSSNEGG
jgi:ribosomal subunit interface protein